MYDAKQRQCDAVKFVPECANTEEPSISPVTDIQISDIILAPELSQFFSLIIFFPFVLSSMKTTVHVFCLGLREKHLQLKNSILEFEFILTFLIHSIIPLY